MIKSECVNPVLADKPLLSSLNEAADKYVSSYKWQTNVSPDRQTYGGGGGGGGDENRYVW